MFSDSPTEIVGFSSCAIGVTSSQDVEAQTDQRAYEDRDCQAGSSRSVEAQTESATHNAVPAPEVDYDRLAAFLRRVCPKVLTELDKAERSRAFHGYDPIEEGDDGEVKKLYTLLTPEVKARAEVKVGGLVWSCTGGVIAVGYGRLEHEGWCDHSSVVHLFNINRQDFSPTSPGRSLETSSCVTSLAAHPSEPYLLAVGMFSGEVVVWNLQSDVEVLVGSSTGSHQEAVSQLCWVRSPDPTHARPLLASAGRDGCLFLWLAGPALGSFRMVDGFVVTLEHSGRKHSRIQSSPLGGRSSTEVGITCLSFSPHDPGSFVVGLEGGGVLRCSTLFAKQSPVSSVIPLKDPVLTAYEGHQCTVTCVRHSVHDRGLFLSCDATEIHVHEMDQASPLRVIRPASEVLGMEWMGSPPSLFCAWGPAGTLQYHSVSSNDAPFSPMAITSEDHDQSPVTAVCFSPRSVHQLVAVGDVRGKIMVWKIPGVKEFPGANSIPADKH